VCHQLQQLGIEVFYGDEFSPEELLRSRAGYYDVVIISRPHNGIRFLPLARQHFPNSLIVYDAEALFSIRDILQAQVEGRTVSEKDRKKMLKKELEIMRLADVVITVSDTERATILEEGGHPNVVVWGHTHEIHTPITPFSKRKDLLFVGAFTRGHPPNTDAVLYFVNRVFPKIHKQLPECRFIVVGSNPPESIRDLSSESIIVTGFVEDLREYYEKCRVFVVPLRFGAGINYKLTEAMSYGIPAVVSNIAATGLDIRDGKEALIANDEKEFAEKVVRLYEDETLWNKIQHAAQDYIRKHCSWEVMKQKLADILNTPFSRGLKEGREG